MVEYSNEIIKRIVDGLESGTPLEELCRQNGMPSSRSVRQWVEDDKGGCASYIARAREIGFDVIAENTRNIARGGVGSSGEVERDKLIIYTDIKLLSKWTKKYADKTIHAGDPASPVVIQQKIINDDV